MPKKEVVIKHTAILSAYLLVFWGFYRFLFKLPEEIEELLLKPFFWLLPVFYLLGQEKKGISSLGFTLKNIFPAVYFAAFLGVVFAVEGIVINFIKYQGINFEANIGNKPLFWSLGISFATAISEEVTFRGYLFGRLWSALGNEWRANIITSIIWGLVHVPIAVFWWKLNLAAVIGYLLLTSVFGIGSAFIFARTKNIASSILLHVLWEWPIVLFR